MQLPVQYQNLDINQKRLIVDNLISQYWNPDVQEMVEGFSEEQIEFLFTYFFTEDKEVRERMWNDMQNKYNTVLKELEKVANKLQNINLQLSELLAEREDVASFGKDRR